MKILHISGESSEESVHIGGRGVWLENVLKEQAKLGHEVFLLTWGESDDRYDKPFEHDGYKIVKPGRLLNWKPHDYIAKIFWANIFFGNYALDLCRKHSFDVIHAHDADLAEAYFFPRHAFGTPVVVSIHLSMLKSLYEGYVGGVHNIQIAGYENWLIENADEVMTCSESYKKLIKEIHGVNRDIHVVYNGTDKSQFQPAGDDIKTGKHRIFFAGRIAKQKGLDDLCEIIPEMVKDCEFFITGKVSVEDKQEAEKYYLYQKLKALEKKFPDSVHLLGHVMPHSVIGRIAKQCDVWIAPSWHAPFELVGLEAWACGLPLICTKEGAFLEYTQDGVNCLQIEKKNPKQLKEAIYTVVQDKQLSKKLVENGFNTLENFSWRKTAEKTIEVYKKVVKNANIRLANPGL